MSRTAEPLRFMNVVGSASSTPSPMPESFTDRAFHFVEFLNLTLIAPRQLLGHSESPRCAGSRQYSGPGLPRPTMSFNGQSLTCTSP